MTKPANAFAYAGAARPSFGGLDANAVARAEAALKSLSGQFGAWLQDELAKLDAARAAIRAGGFTQANADQLYLHAHDLKGLGTTYEFPIVSRMAASLCRLIESPARRTAAPLELVDSHIDAIRAAVKDGIKTDDHPLGHALVSELERLTAAHIAAESSSSTAP